MMPAADGFLARVRRASRRSPRYLMTRLQQVVSVRLRRPWSKVLPHVVTARSVVRAAGAGSVGAWWERQLHDVPFFLKPSSRQELTREFTTRYPDSPAAIVAEADRALRHEFDLLGSGCVNLGPALPWHTDFKSGRRWPLQFSPNIDYQELDRPTDIKVPWELSRCQHFTVLGQAYWLTGDERYPREFVAETNDWIARNPWGHGVNWACAMDVALRAVSWIWGFYYMGGSEACAAPAFRRAFVRALYLHGHFVETYIERGDVNGNHYLCDGVGLVCLGAFFRSTRNGRRWLQSGRRIIEDEIFLQTSEDGVDFEKSTAYHRLVLEAFLTCGVLLARHDEPLSSVWQARLERMFEFVEAYVKPDGRTPFIGDADDGRIQKLGMQPLNDHRYLLSTGAALLGRGDFKRGAGRFWEESFWMLGAEGAAAFDRVAAAAAAPVSKAFPDGGFYVLRSDRAHVMIDCGEVGMHGRGGHGHNDILGFELWLDGMNLVTDCGAYLYTASREWRNRFRSTAFHNVVQVDGEELNRFLSPDNLWQLQDDARPVDPRWQSDDRGDWFRGAHTGYQRLAPPVMVKRELLLRKRHVDVVIRDVIEGTAPRELVWRFHLDPAVHAEITGADVRLSVGRHDAWLQPVSGVDRLALSIASGWMSPSYGVRSAIQVVTFRGRVALPHCAAFRIGLVRLAADGLAAAVDELRSDAPASLVGT